jgi:NADPH:quinone reductase-like Zn-dependent oxidoreductase
VRAVVIKGGGTLVLEERPDPVPGAGEVLVRIRAAGLNGADISQRRGGYAAPPGSPADIPGLELAGEVAAAGPGTFRFEPGDRVMGIVGGGAQAELLVVNERLLMPVPADLDWISAGGLAEAFTTAHDALFTQAGLESGERLLVHGAAGGVGTAAVQLGCALGARVTATVRNPEHREAVGAFGACVIEPEGFGTAGPFDLVLELVGAPNMAENIEALDISGRIAVIGVGAGADVELSLRALMRKSIRIYSSALRGRPLLQKALVARAIERNVLPLFDSGRLTVPIAATYPLAEVERAYDRFTRGGKFGKIVLHP